MTHIVILLQLGIVTCKESIDPFFKFHTAHVFDLKT